MRSPFGGARLGCAGSTQRSLHKAEVFARHLSAAARIIPVAFDRDGDVAQQIATLAPDIVVDASGPFQAYGHTPYRVAEAAIAAGANYLDLADSTDFVCNIGMLDSAAMEKGVFVLSGTSTCPVLTAAVARELSNDLERIDSIAGGIAPSPFAGMGRSVVEAIAGYAGKPVEVIRNGSPAIAHTFGSTKKFTIAPPGVIPLFPMTFSLIDVPNLSLLGELDKPAGNTWFGVATTPSIYHRVLRLLARAVKVRILPTLKPLTGIMHFFMNYLSWDEHRGGMFVEVRGTDPKGASVKKTWHVIAEGDNGPAIPALAALALIRRCQEGIVPAAGARPAVNELELDDYLSMFVPMGIRAGNRCVTDDDVPPIFEAVLGCTLDTLPNAVQKLHGVRTPTSFSGRASVSRGRGLLARSIARIARFPETVDDVPVTVKITPQAGTETWERDFNGHMFSSELRPGVGRFEGLMCERFGPVGFGIALVVEGDRLRWILRRWSLLGIPMPKWMMPCGDMHETVVDGKFVFHVEICMPFIGHVVTYTGWLEQR